MDGEGGGWFNWPSKMREMAEYERQVLFIVAIVSVSDFYVPSFLVEVVRK